MKIDTKEKIEAFIDFIMPFYKEEKRETWNWDKDMLRRAKKQARGYYMLETLMIIASSFEANKIRFDSNYSLKTQKSERFKQGLERITVDAITNIELIEAKPQECRQFNQFIKKAKILQLINLDTKLVEMICSGSMSPMFSHFSLTPEDRKEKLSRLKIYNDAFIELFDSSYQEIKGQWDIFTEKFNLLDSINPNINSNGYVSLDSSLSAKNKI